MRLQSCITQATLSLALTVSPFAPHSTAQDMRQQASLGSQSWLGVGIVDLTPDKARQLGLNDAHGVEIALVAKGGPAEDAGIQRGDVITSFGVERVEDAEHLANLVRAAPSGKSVSLGVWRDGEWRQVNIIVELRGGPNAGDLAEQFKRKAGAVGFDIPRPITVIRNRTLGVEIEELEGQLAKHFGVEQGVLVRSVDPGSPAEKAGIAAGDVIVRIGANRIEDPRDVRRSALNAVSAVDIGIVRNRRARTLTLAKDEQPGGAWPMAGHN